MCFGCKAGEGRWATWAPASSGYSVVPRDRVWRESCRRRERERSVVNLKSYWPLQKRKGGFVTSIGCSLYSVGAEQFTPLTRGKSNQQCLKRPSSRQLELICSGSFRLCWPVQNGCHISGNQALSALSCCLHGNGITSCLFLHNSLLEARKHQRWAQWMWHDRYLTEPAAISVTWIFETLFQWHLLEKKRKERMRNKSTVLQSQWALDQSGMELERWCFQFCWPEGLWLGWHG